MDGRSGIPLPPPISTRGAATADARWDGLDAPVWMSGLGVNNASWPLAAGTYRVIGYFGGVAGPAATLVVTP